MISIRTGLFITSFLGAMYAVLGLFTSLQDAGIGMAVASIGVIGWGLCDWLER